MLRHTFDRKRWTKIRLLLSTHFCHNNAPSYLSIIASNWKIISYTCEKIHSSINYINHPREKWILFFIFLIYTKFLFRWIDFWRCSSLNFNNRRPTIGRKIFSSIDDNISRCNFVTNLCICQWTFVIKFRTFCIDYWSYIDRFICNQKIHI